METFNMHHAKTHLSRLIDRLAGGGGFIIAKAGKPVAKVMALDTPPESSRTRLGFLKGQMRVPDDFDRMGATELEAMFGGQP